MIAYNYAAARDGHANRPAANSERRGVPYPGKCSSVVFSTDNRTAVLTLPVADCPEKPLTPPPW